MNKRLHDDVVIIVLKRNKSAQHQYYKQQRRGSVIDESTSSNQSFYLELNISSPSSNKRKFNQLKWKHYAVNLVRVGVVWFYFSKWIFCADHSGKESSEDELWANIVQISTVNVFKSKKLPFNIRMPITVKCKNAIKKAYNHRLKKRKKNHIFRWEIKFLMLNDVS